MVVPLLNTLVSVDLYSKQVHARDFGKFVADLPPIPLPGTPIQTVSSTRDFERILEYLNPKGFTSLHIDVVPARFTAPLALKLHQTSAVEIHCPASLRRTHVADPSGTVVRMAILKFDEPESLHNLGCGT
jgi:hypothetical protein